MYAGDFLMSAAALTSGNNFTKLRLFGQFAHLGWPSESLFLRIQRLYAVPAILQYWDVIQQAILQERLGKRLIVAGMFESTLLRLISAPSLINMPQSGLAVGMNLFRGGIRRGTMHH